MYYRFYSYSDVTQSVRPKAAATTPRTVRIAPPLSFISAVAAPDLVAEPEEDGADEVALALPEAEFEALPEAVAEPEPDAEAEPLRQLPDQPLELLDGVTASTHAALRQDVPEPDSTANDEEYWEVPLPSVTLMDLDIGCMISST